MALVQVDISSYDNFKSVTMGNGYDIDSTAGFQCWDYGALLWGNIGRFGHSGVPYNYPYLSTANTGYAYGIWLARTENAGSEFDLITDINNVKKGDMVVLDKGRFTGDESGHNAFADEDYDGSGYMWLVGQNQENPSATLGHVVTRNRMSVLKFLGAFRYKKWASEPPIPPYIPSKKKFPWVLYARKLREQR